MNEPTDTMGRADDKKGEALLSEADDEKDKDYSDKEASDEKDKDYSDKEASEIDGPDVECKKKYKCTEPGCTARFLRPSRLTWHLRKHNDERPYKCSQEGCDRAYTNSSHLKRHENSHKPITTTYTCKQCLLEVGSLFSLKRHRRMIHDPKRLTCEECGAKFRKKHCYNEHLSMHAGISMYNCKVCNQEFKTLRLVKRHQLIHEKHKSYACKSPGCTEIFDKWSKLGKHMETEHQFDKKCQKCDKRFKNKAQLSLHEAIHANQDIYSPCPYKYCPRFYVHQKNLEEHIEVYHRGRKFHCDTCDKEFTSKASIIRHIKLIHELTQRPPAKRRKKQRRRRNDAGVPKKSMALKLAGLEVPYELEKRVLRRRTKIVLEQDAESIMSLDEGKGAKSCSSVNLARNEMDMNLEKSCHVPEQTEEEILCSAGSLLQTGKLIIMESNTDECSDSFGQINEEITVMSNELLQKYEKSLEKSSIVPDETDDEMSIDLVQIKKLDILKKPIEQSSTVPEEMDEEISLLAKELLQSDAGIVLEKLLQKSFDAVEAKDSLGIFENNSRQSPSSSSDSVTKAL